MWLVDLLKLQHVSWDLYILKQIDFSSSIWPDARFLLGLLIQLQQFVKVQNIISRSFFPLKVLKVVIRVSRLDSTEKFFEKLTIAFQFDGDH